MIVVHETELLCNGWQVSVFIRSFTLINTSFFTSNSLVKEKNLGFMYYVFYRNFMTEGF